jgi:hypothetical protein
MHKGIAAYRSALKGVFALCLLMLCVLPLHAGAVTSPFPGSFPLDALPCPLGGGLTPTYKSMFIPDDPICMPVFCGLEIPVIPCLAAPAQNCCKDDREKNVKIVGPMAPPPQVGNTVSTMGTAGPPYTTKAGITQFTIDLTGPGNGTQGAMPSANDNPLGMPHKDTPAIQLVNEYPWLYKDTDTTHQYFLYRGTGNNTYANIDSKLDTSSLLALDNDDDTSSTNNLENISQAPISQIQCSAPVYNCGTGAQDDPANYQYWVRLQLDACTNQYLIPMGLNPQFVFSDSYRYDNYAWNESFCQPLVLTPVPCLQDLVNDNTGKTCLQDYGSADLGKTIYGNNTPIMYDYRAWGYLERAWQDVLYKSSYSPASGTNPNVLTIGATSGSISPGSPLDGFKSYGQPFNYSLPGNRDYNSGTAPANSNTFKGNLTTINDLSLRPYERIFDSTHPYTPRFDMVTTGNTTDRSYSDQTNIIQLNGNINLNGYNALTSSCYVRCASVPVDILSFRSTEFNNCMTCRINVNSQCFWDEVIANIVPTIITLGFFPIPIGGGGGVNSIMDPITALIDTIEGQSPTWEWFDNHDCKTYLQMATNNIYTNANSSGSNISAGGLGAPAGLWPPCSTQFDTPIDNVPAMCAGCVALANDYANTTDHQSSVTKCCSDLAQAVAPVNTLKIRNLQDDPTLKDTAGNVPEGYAFQAYFPPDTAANAIKDAIGNTSLGQVHMPYMRWWDTGQAAGGGGWPQITPLFLNPQTNYDPLCDKGKDDTIVGIGLESQNTTPTGSPAGLCRYGGTAGKGYSPLDSSGNPVACINVGATTKGIDTAGKPITYITDRLTSWFELKEYQTNAMRYYGLNCMPMHEKLFKHLQAEDGVLYQAGKHFNSMVPEPGFTTAGASDPTHSLYELRQNPWPLRWRGYLSDQQDGNTNTGKYRFPNFDPDKATGSVPAGALLTGLDNAKVGDIIYVTEQDVFNKGVNVVPFMAVVTGAVHNTGKTTSNLTGCTNSTDCTDITATCSDYVEVVDQNYGKFPDACGNTDYIGQGQTRRIFKEWLPTNIQDVIFQGESQVEFGDSCGDTHEIDGGGTALKLNALGSCEDPKYAVCTFNPYYQSAKPNPDGTWSIVGDTDSSPGFWNSVHIYRPSLDERGEGTSR